ncbi:cellulose synthase-like protein E6 [Vitis vinifera]|uniref:cellulose synthase-like protein E6 n=1 Tax=Vitis vinifera TaxID=29760 RepID=UPI002882D790|nr:cellulose synthase-like protein E6 [Vitis vinifera]
MVINTVLSVMAYDYLPKKLGVYLSDDGGSCLTFYALLEVSQFSKIWLPFCKKFKVEPRCPEAYFTSTPEPHHDDPLMVEEWSSIKKLYEDMRNRIESTMKVGQISEEIRKQHKGFGEWDLVSDPRNHQTILQVLLTVFYALQAWECIDEMLVAEIVDILLDVAVYIETYSLKGVTVLGSFAE